jgi:hypothetical protein
MVPKFILNFTATCDDEVQIQLSGSLVFYGKIEALKMKNVQGN